MILENYYYKLNSLVLKYNDLGGRYKVQGLYYKNNFILVKIEDKEGPEKLIGLYEFVFNPEYKFYYLLSNKKKTTPKKKRLIINLFKLFFQGGGK
jgi:hypothetical protein